MASLSVKSTRYTLKELKHIEPFNEDDFEGASRFIVLTGNEDVDRASIQALNNLQALLKKGISNDIAKFALPECYKTELTWSLNARSLQNFLTLRSSKSALWEIRNLAYKVYEALPNEHKYLFDECMAK
jgi:thymidylate synthase (FAD)